jgi:hypothetical protein
MSRGGIRLAATSGVAVLLIVWAPPAHASGAPGSGAPNNCTPILGGQVGPPTNPTVVAADAVVNCPLVSGPTGVPYGNSQSRGTVSRGTPGQPCRYVIEQPTKVKVTGPDTAVQMDPDNTGTKYGSFSYPQYMAMYPVQVAAKNNIYMPYLFTGKYDANGLCTVPVGGDIAGSPGWQLGCPDPVPFYNIVVAGNLCNTFTPNAVTRPGGLVNPGVIVPFLNVGNIKQYINQGTMSSLPKNPDRGLVNIGTCFFVTGATFTVPGGPPQTVQRPVTYEMSVSEPVNDGTGRYVFYLFRIQISLLQPEWHFENGPNASTVDGQLPGPCQNVPNDIAASHTYTRYGDYQVTLIEHFGLRLDEYWSDADGEHHIQVNNVLPAYVPTPLPVYPKSVLQEVGVPTNG